MSAFFSDLLLFWLQIGRVTFEFSLIYSSLVGRRVRIVKLGVAIGTDREPPIGMDEVEQSPLRRLASRGAECVLFRFRLAACSIGQETKHVVEGRATSAPFGCRAKLAAAPSEIDRFCVRFA